MKIVDIIIKNAYVITMNPQREIIQNASIIINEGKILEICKEEATVSYSSARVINAKGKFVFPGFVNTHAHLLQTMFKGLGQDFEQSDWFKKIILPTLPTLDEEACYYAVLAGAIDAVRSGTTTLLDYMHYAGLNNYDDAICRAFEDLGVRAVYGRGFSKYKENYDDDVNTMYNEKLKVFFSETERLLQKYRNHPRISVCLAPGQVSDLSEQSAREVRRLANEYKTIITMHILEDFDDDEYSILFKDLSTVAYLEKLGILGPDFLAVHCVDVQDEDLEILKKFDVKISHCPVSNMALGVGVAPVPLFHKNGFCVSLGTDGALTNDTQNMFETLKITSLLQRVFEKNRSVMPASTVLEMATLSGAIALNKQDEIGSLEAGKRADLFIYNPNNITSIPVHDPINAVVFASSKRNVETTIIEGKIIMDYRNVLTVDEEKVLSQTRKIAKKLVETSGAFNSHWGRIVDLTNFKSAKR